jgi:dipeptidyl-peptidase-4
MPAMFRIVACAFAVVPLFAQDVTQKARPLQPIDMFRLDFGMVMGAEEPKGWLDAEHYLVFDAGPTVMPGRGQPKWSAVEARSGKRTPHLDHVALRQALHVALPDFEELDAALGDADSWTWSKDHTRCVVHAANDLFAAGVDGAAVRLTHTPEIDEVGVSFSADGKWVAFIAEHNLHVVPTAGGEVRDLTIAGNDDLFFGRLDWVYQEELYGRGNFQGYWWSPDGARIALLRLDEAPVQEFVLVGDYPARPAVEKTNYPKTGEPNPNVDLGVIDVASGAVRWFDLAAYPLEDRLIVRVTWAPDGKEVLFQVQNREQTWLDMLGGDAATGVVRKLFREDSDCWVEAGPEPEWIAGGSEFLWLSERDGYRHLYRYARSGALVGRLTEGPWQVKQVAAVDDAGGFLFVTADKDSPLQTHLYRVPLAGGEMQRITQGRGTHDVSMAPGQATFVTTWSDVNTPACVSLRDLQDNELRAIATSKPQMLAPYGLAEPEFLQVTTRDGFPMEAMLLKPRDLVAGTACPVVQFTYSGPHTPRVRDEWGGRDYLWHQLLVQRGYVVFVCDNRSASGKGRVFAKAC